MEMTVKLDEPIEVSPEIAGGMPRTAGRRIRVQDVAIWHERLGMSPDEIAAEYDLSLADVQAALTYYFDHRAEIDRAIREGEALVGRLREQFPSKLQQRPGALHIELL